MVRVAPATLSAVALPAAVRVSTRDELLALMVDQVNGEFLLPARRTGSWR
jgi:hypothetical protein